MVKEPRPGRVKTRLGRDIGMTAAAAWYRRQSLSTLRALRDRRWRVVVAVAPDRAGLASRVWPAGLARVPQGPGDLGDRMGRLFRRMPPGEVLIVGSDIPGITPGHIARAFEALRGSDAVIGPAFDGGYWLIGLRRQRPVPRGLFRGVRWSGQHALADTVGTVGAFRVTRVDALADVDTAADLP